MSIIGVLIATGITIAALGLGIVIRRMSEALVRFRGRRLVTCPEDHRSAGVRVNAVHAALTAWGGSPDLKLSGCSHWADRASCGQECVQQIEAAPAECLVRNLVRRWCEGKCCARCGGAIGGIHWDGPAPGFVTTGDIAKELNEISWEQLLETLQTASPLCFRCYAREKASGHPLGATAT